MNRIIAVEVRQLQGLDYSQIIFCRNDGSMKEYKFTGDGWGYSAGRLLKALSNVTKLVDIHSNGIGVTYYR